MKHSKPDNPQPMPRPRESMLKRGFALTVLCLLCAISSNAQTPATGPRLTISGFAMMDTGIDFGSSHPDWFDVMRPTKLPSFENEFGKDGRWFAGVRQTRFGVKGFIPTDAGEIKTNFEFELFGTGVDAGQTTFRLRHAWGEFHQVGAGQTWSPFMDPDVFPNSIEYWGPNGMVFFRNVQARWTPWTKGDSRFVLALERPGAGADQGNYASRIELQNVKARFPWPDISSHFRYADDWGHVQIAGIFRKMKWDDTVNDAVNLDGGDIGFGINLSSNLKIKKDVVRLQVVYGEGIQNYMNDAPADIGVVTNFSNPVTPLLGKAIPMMGYVAFLDHTWNDQFTSTIGYSRVDIDNTNGQAPDAFRVGQYALTNILYTPAKGVLFGPEFQWGQRSNNSDGFTFNDYRVQFSFKYNFSADVGGK